MSDRSENEFNLIESQGWFDAMRQYAGGIFGHLRDNGVTVEGELHFSIWLVPVEILQINARECRVQAGKDDEGNPLFEWRIPFLWILPMPLGGSAPDDAPDAPADGDGA